MMPLVMLKLPDTAGNRMLSKREAAGYCRIPVNKFSAVCPVVPIDLGTGLSYDLKDLDEWIDSLKVTNASDDESIANQVG